MFIVKHLPLSFNIILPIPSEQMNSSSADVASDGGFNLQICFTVTFIVSEYFKCLKANSISYMCQVKDLCTVAKGREHLRGARGR